MEKNEKGRSFGILKGLNVLDLFSGIGGFSLGLEQTGQKISWHGFSDIDKYANELFKRRYPNAEQLGSVTDVSYKSIGRRIDLLTGGFPCQSFSIAGSRGGFSDTRGTLFFEIERILRDFIENKSPIPMFLLENVKGLLNHDSGQTFATIYGILADLDYTLECQLVNTRWFLPQNRERIFIFGRYNGNPSGRKIFPIGKDGGEVAKKGIRIVGHSGTGGQKGHIHSTDGIMSCLSATDYKQPKQIEVADYRNDEGLRVRKDGVSPCLSNRRHSETDVSTMPPIIVHTTQPRSGNPNEGGTGPLSKDDGTAYCLDTGNTQAIEIIDKKGKKKNNQDHASYLAGGAHSGGNHSDMDLLKKENRIRRLTPTECERLQGFPDGWTDGQSNTQRYKQLGNAVSVPVIKAIMERIFDES